MTTDRPKQNSEPKKDPANGITEMNTFLDTEGDLPLAIAATVQEDKKALNTSHLNMTAYRIFKLLQWLNEQPLTAEELNDRFFNDPDIKRKLSTDSIWLYISTLKTLGCQIRRPSRSNGYRYELLKHPFGVVLSQATADLLIELKQILEEKLSVNEVLAFDRMLKRVTTRSVLEGTLVNEAEQEALSKLLFKESRSLDYQQTESLIECLEVAIENEELIEIIYQSPLHGKRLQLCVPVQLSYQGGVLYVHAYVHGRNEPSMFRLDRISTVRDSLQKGVREQILIRKQTSVQVVIRFLTAHVDDLSGCDWADNKCWVDDGASSGVEVTVETQDFFWLRQRIMELGIPFMILSPDLFRQELIQSLSQLSLM